MIDLLFESIVERRRYGVMAEGRTQSTGATAKITATDGLKSTERNVR